MSATDQHNGQACLCCEDLHVSFYQDEGVGRAVRGVGFEVGKSRTLGIVGESGCGKSVTALSILRLVPCPPGKIEQGRIVFGGRNLLDLDNESMRAIRGKNIS
ncbi:MAG: ATP-binding cassette domain-containing protein, partial [Planctomycetota bacterium]